MLRMLTSRIVSKPPLHRLQWRGSANYLSVVSEEALQGFLLKPHEAVATD